MLRLMTTLALLFISVQMSAFAVPVIVQSKTLISGGDLYGNSVDLIGGGQDNQAFEYNGYYDRDLDTITWSSNAYEELYILDSYLVYSGTYHSDYTLHLTSDLTYSDYFRTGYTDIAASTRSTFTCSDNGEGLLSLCDGPHSQLSGTVPLSSPSPIEHIGGAWNQFVFRTSEIISGDTTRNTVFLISFNNFAGDGYYEPPYMIDSLPVTAVPVPASLWLFGSSVIALMGIKRRKAGDVARIF